MAPVGHILLLATSVTFALVFGVMVVGAMIRGCVKLEPGQDWIVFRKQPIKFVVILLLLSGLAAWFGIAVFRIATKFSL